MRLTVLLNMVTSNSDTPCLYWHVISRIWTERSFFMRSDSRGTAPVPSQQNTDSDVDDDDGGGDGVEIIINQPWELSIHAKARSLIAWERLNMEEKQ